jgi:hypothetical protein
VTEFVLIAVGIAAASAGVRDEVVMIAVAAGLQISSLPKYFGLLESARKAGAERQWLATVGLSIVLSIAVAVGVVAVGKVVRLMWL